MDIAATPRPEFAIVKSMFSAILVTLALFYFMHRLVYTEAVPEPVPSRPMPEIVAIPQQITEEKPDVKPERPKEPLEQPTPEPFEPQLFENNPNINPIDLGYKPNKTIDEGRIKVSSGGIIQQVMVPPTYPARALTRGIEGFVDVQFQVNAMGSTAEVRIMRANPEGVFDKAAIRAVKRWKYLPDEERIQPAILQERIRFSIQQ